MKHFDRLEMNELIDLMAKHSFTYSELKKKMASGKEVQKHRSIVEDLMKEIEKRTRATIGPYNDISGSRPDDRMKTA
jgi:hypothetical protein